MKCTIPRAGRRRLRRHADVIAEVLAASVRTRQRGQLRPITDTEAQRILARGFADLLRNDCQPIVHRLTEAEAATLPGYRPTPAGAIWFAAFGLDVEGRGTFVSRYAWSPDLTAADLAEAAEIELLAALAAECNSGALREAKP